MNQTQQLLKTLKLELRRRGFGYARVGEYLGLSEASVKRLFSKHSFSMQRLEAVCDLIGLTMFELAERARSTPGAITELSREQEMEFVTDHGLLLMAVLVLNGWTFDEILGVFRFTEHEAIRYLARLDRMKMIELLPGNRVRRLVARNFTWRNEGPVQRFFEKYIRDEFFACRFNGQGEHLRLASGILSQDSMTRLQQKIDEWVKEMDEAVQADADLPLSHRTGASMVLALRPFEPSVFTRFRREHAG